MLALVARYTPSPEMTAPLVLLTIGLAGILISMFLGIAPIDQGMSD